MLANTVKYRQGAAALASRRQSPPRADQVQADRLIVKSGLLAVAAHAHSRPDGPFRSIRSANRVADTGAHAAYTDARWHGSREQHGHCGSSAGTVPSSCRASPPGDPIGPWPSSPPIRPRDPSQGPPRTGHNFRNGCGQNVRNAQLAMQRARFAPRPHRVERRASAYRLRKMSRRGRQTLCGATWSSRGPALSGD